MAFVIFVIVGISAYFLWLGKNIDEMNKTIYLQQKTIISQQEALAKYQGKDVA